MCSVRVRVAVVVVVAAGFAARLDAQAISLDLVGPSPGAAFGDALAVVGDLDGDGRPDLAVGAPFDAAPALATAADGFTGSVSLLSGFDGHLLGSASGTQASELYGWSVAAAGDVNGDGVPDVLVGAPNFDAFRGRVEVLSGAGGGVLLTLLGNSTGDRFGWSVAPLGDVDGDGLDDFAVGAWNDSDGLLGQGTATAYTGASGDLIASWSGAQAFDHFGSAVAAAGDVNLDGVVDLLVAGETIDGIKSDTGGVTLESVVSGAPLFTWFGDVPGDDFGHSVAGVGDATGDGVPDVLVGAPAAHNGDGEATLFSGANGAVVISLTDFLAGGQMGTCVAGAGDLDGDGRPDLAVGTPLVGFPLTIGPGHAGVYSSVTGAELRGLNGVTSLGGTGTALAAADFDLDGKPDLVAGEPFEGGAPVAPGLVRILSGDDWIDIGAGLAGTGGVPKLVAQGQPVAGQAVSLQLQHAAAGAPSLLIVGFSSLQAKFKGGTLVPHPDWFSPLMTVGQDGTLTLASTWPAGAPVGTQFWFQWWIADAGTPHGWASTQGLRVAAQ